MDVAITGTPGTGKTTLCEVLAQRGHTVLTTKELALELGCAITSADEEMEIDVSSLAAKMHGYTAGLGDTVFIDGHLSHLLAVDMIIVLRFSPIKLEGRLAPRGYSVEKQRENLEAEGVGVCLTEALETQIPVAEIDTTSMDVEGLADIIEKLVDKARGGEDLSPYEPGKVDWIEEVSKWY